MRVFRLCFVCLCAAPSHVHVKAAFNQAQEIDYLDKFQSIDQASYAAVDDPSSSVPDGLLDQCKGDNDTPSVEVYVTATSGTISSSSVADQCDYNTICIIPSGVVLEMNQSLNVGALIVRGSLEWNAATTSANDAAAQTIYLCAGYVAVEDNGSFVMDVQLPGQSAWIYMKDNGALHPSLRTRAFGGVADENSNDSPTVDIQGRKLTRTWSLLSDPLLQGENTMRLMHNPTLMGWIVGDRIAIAPTEVRSEGSGQEFRISAISNSGVITLSDAAQYNFDAEFYPPANVGGEPVLKSAEVVNLDRSIVITGDDFSQVPCENDQVSSWKGCQCSSFRSTCTYGLHTAQFYGGAMKIKDTRVEKCGQRGVVGKYCLHFHKLEECPDCVFENNAIENSHQRGIIVHGTHLSTVEGNTLYNVRGAGVYIEDGNEMYNYIKYNVNICPFPFNDDTLHGCTVPGTDNGISDTSDNQAAFYLTAATNDLIGNRAANSFNGHLLFGGNIGRGSSAGKVCGPDARIGRTEGNVFHGHGRFGTYSLGGNYPKVTDQAVDTNGHNIDQSLCHGFDNEGNTRGLSATFKNHLDYHNTFVGHYEAGDIQYNGHNSYDNLNLIYWKETKNFQNGCSAHITNSYYSKGNMALPDMGTFIIENTTFGDGVQLEPNHHCNVGVTGVLCMPQYVLHNVHWKNFNEGMKWVWFQSYNTQGHNANQHHGGIFTLSPPDAEIVMGGNDLPASLFPSGYVSLVSSKFTYLLDAPDNLCVLSSSLGGNYGLNYDDGILCKVPLRSLKVYTQNLLSGSAPDLKVEVWFNDEGLDGQDLSSIDAWQNIGFHQIGDDNASAKQGYSLPVIPGTDKSYRLSLSSNDPTIPHDWVVEFSDVVIGNRWADEQIYLALEGRACGNNGLVSSRHDRRFIWSGDNFMDGAWGNHGACIATGSQPEDMPIIDCEVEENDGFLEPTECPELCHSSCGNNSYCDCGTLTCNCKAGFTGDDCSIDLCAAARCTSTGTCSARYLGYTLPVTSDKACICNNGWSGNSCNLNPCAGVNCSGHGTCIANGNIGVCECDPGYSGDECETSCDGVCPGSYPYGCATSIPNIVRYGCLPGGGCHYLASGEEYPYDGFCTYQDDESSIPCECTTENDCEVVGPCLIDGSCPNPVELPDGTICNSVPWGICKAGVCTATSSPPTPSSPTLSPLPTTATTPSPTTATTPSPTKATTPSPSFLRVPTDTPVASPSHSPCAGVNCSGHGTCIANGNIGVCECDPGYSGDECETSCDDVCPGSYPYGCATSLPNIVRYGCLPGGGCHYLASGEEYPYDGFCTYLEDDSILSPIPSTTPSPTPSPTTSPTTYQIGYPCGCEDCTDGILDTPVGDPPYTCRERIIWLQSVDGGAYSEYDACVKVAFEEFPDECGPMCDPDRCNVTPLPSFASPIPSPTPSQAPLPPTSACGCEECTDQILDTYAGIYTCRARIDYLMGEGYTEVEACRQVAGEEFPTVCGPACDPNRCDETNAPITPAPTLPPVQSPSSLYCFPPDDGSRVTYLDMWDGSYKVEVKEGDICGPGDNRFSRNTVSRSANELTLQFKKNGSIWEASEVRIVIPDGTPFKYGNYTFHIKSVAVKNSGGTILSDILPKEIVLGLFTWDPTEDNSINQNWNHEVDIEISRWGSDTNADTQFLVQPPGSPQMYRFYSGVSSGSYEQSNHWHSFKWLPNEISWLSTAGGGQSHVYTTESAILGGGIDYVQCLPADVEIRLNLWSVNGMDPGPSGLNDDDYVEVIIDNFKYEKDGIEFAAPGDYCSKHCQCEAALGCSNGQCVHTNTPSLIPSSSLSNISSTNTPSLMPSIEGTIPCYDSLLKLSFNSGLSCATLFDFGACSSPVVQSHCPNICDACPTYQCEDSLAPFVAGANVVRCAYLQGLSDTQIDEYCELPQLYTTCRRTCKLCDV